MPPLREILNRDSEKAFGLFVFFYSVLREEYGEDYMNRDERVWEDMMEKTQGYQLWFDYDWYGNLREFTNYMKRNLVLNKWDDLPVSSKGKVENYNIEISVQSGSRFPTFAKFEKDYLSQLMMCANGVKKRASDISGLSLSTIGRKLKEYKIS